MRLFDRLVGTRSTRAVSESQFLETWRLRQVDKDSPAYDFAGMANSVYSANGIVFAVILARMALFSEATLRFRSLSDKHMFGSPALLPLERPWPGGTTSELLARMEQHASLGGQALVVRDGAGVKLLRPDWVQRVSVLDGDDDFRQRRLVGYIYNPTGFMPGFQGTEWEDPVYYTADEVAAWMPIPDPLNPWRGMSWLTPVVREINADAAMATHKQKFFDNAATPNLVIRYQKKLPDGYVKAFAEQFEERHAGVDQSWRTVILDEAADLTVVGSSFDKMQFTELQSAGETRIASAGGVPPIVAGLKEGLDAATYSNYAMAMRRFADLTMRPNWRGACGALQQLVDVPAGAQLWYDTTDIAALQEGEKEQAEAAQVNAATLSTLIAAGYTPESATAAVISGDFSILRHTGLVSVQLQPPGGQDGELPETAGLISAEEGRALLKAAGFPLSGTAPAPVKTEIGGSA